MSLVGFLTNIKEGLPPTRDFALFRIASMDETLRTLGAQLFVYSPRQVDPETGQVSGFFVEGGRMVPATAPVPEVNGSWYIGPDRSSQPKMRGRQFRVWAAERGIDIHPDYEFSRLIKDKYRTFRFIRDRDRTLHPHTARFDGSPEQLSHFLRRCESVFLKPRFGSKGDDIFSVRLAAGGFECAYYLARQKQTATHATLADALAAVNRGIGDKPFLIQEGVAIDRFDDAPFIFRVIMLDDGRQWQWVHKAVLAAPASEIANTTQGGFNWRIIDLLTVLYGSRRASELFADVERVSFDNIRRLGELFPGTLMEVAFDFVLDKQQKLKILEINTLPGMTKPGLPPEPAFADIFNRQPAEQEVYEKFVLPHGSCLARFLHARLEQRRAAPGAAPRGGTVERLARDAPVANRDFLVVDPAAPRLHHVIARQAQYLVRACLPNGMFRYCVNMSADVNVKPRYHVLRHAGAIHALNEHERWHASPEVRATAQRAGRFLKRRCLAPIPGEERLLGLWSRPELGHARQPDAVRVGCVGVGLVALLGLERHSPGFSTLDELRALGEFLLWAQDQDGRFRSGFVPSAGGWQDDPDPLYYPGQAASALAMLHERDPSPKWVQAAADAIGCLARTQEEAAKPAADHWTLMAIARLLPVYDQCQPRVSRATLMRLARQICESILAEQVRDPANPAADGGFARNGNTKPTASGLEGLAAALTFLGEEDLELRERIRSATQGGVGFLMRACVVDGPHAGAMPKAIGPLPEDEAGSVDFNQRATEIRIDYLQHALCALVDCARLSVTAPAPAVRKPAPVRGGDKLLFTPGPLTTSRGVKQAMLRDLGSRDAEFIATVERVRDGLLRVAGVSRDAGYEAVPMQGSGTFAIESVVSSAVPRDGALLVISNGAYGDRIAAIAARLEIETEVLRCPEDERPDAAAVDRALAERPDLTHVAAVHCETSTGMLNPVGAIGAVVRRHRRSYLIDSMSGFGALPVDLEGWGVDFLVSSANKCIQGVPGFAFVLCQRAALESCQDRARSFSLDLFAQWAGLRSDGQFRFTPPTHALLAFETALKELADEGGAAGRLARYRANQTCLVRGMRELGFKEYLAPELQAPIITSFRCPEVVGFDFVEFYQRLNAKGFVIYPGKVAAADCFRIGNIGHVFEPDVRALLGAIEATVQEMGIALRA